MADGRASEKQVPDRGATSTTHELSYAVSSARHDAVPVPVGLPLESRLQLLSVVVGCYVERADFRVIHISIQDNHLHLIVEAASSLALERGMRGFSIKAARAIHAAYQTCGRIFARYHSAVIRSRRYARNVLAYVLGNWRRHREDIVNGRLVTAMLDRFSSAVSFPGWSRRFSIPADYQPLPVSSPRTALLRDGWAIDGPLDPFDAPGPLWR